MTNAKMAERLDEIARDLEGMDSGNADFLRAGAEALREMDDAKLAEPHPLRQELADALDSMPDLEQPAELVKCGTFTDQPPLGTVVRVGRGLWKQIREERAAALREVERLRGALHDIYSIASRGQVEPELSTGDLVDICTICEDYGGDTPDPSDVRIAELEAALRPFSLALGGNYANQPDDTDIKCGLWDGDTRWTIELRSWRKAQSALKEAQ